jgi:hypothetical protein
VKLANTVSYITKPRHDHPGYGWAALATLVAIADITGSKSMSAFFRETARDPLLGPVLIVGWAYLNAHLFGLLPPKYDLFHQAAHIVGRSCLCAESLEELSKEGYA